MTISFEKTFQGAWRLSTVLNGYLFTRQYFGYMKREAEEEFKQEVKEVLCER